MLDRRIVIGGAVALSTGLFWSNLDSISNFLRIQTSDSPVNPLLTLSMLAYMQFQGGHTTGWKQAGLVTLMAGTVATAAMNPSTFRIISALGATAILTKGFVESTLDCLNHLQQMA